MTVPASKQVLMIAQAAATAASTASGIVDTIGFDYASIDIILATMAATTNNPSVLRLMESDDTVVTNFAAIAEFVGDNTTDGFVIADADTSNAQGYRFDVNLVGRERYLRIEISPVVTTQIVSVIANLSRADELPVTAAKAGVVVLVQA